MNSNSFKDFKIDIDEDESEDDGDYIEQLAAQISILAVSIPRDIIANGTVH